MGSFCTVCARRNTENDENEDSNIIKANNSINLPKQYVEAFDLTKNTEAEEPIIQSKETNNMKPKTNKEEPSKNNIDKKGTVEIKSEKSLGSNLNIEEIQNIINDNNNISKISSLNMDLKPNEEIEEPETKKEEENENDNNIAKQVEEVHVSKDNDDLDRNNMPLQNMIIPSKKESNIRKHRHMKSNVFEFNNNELKNEMEENPQLFQRKRRKSTTLKENSNILKQLFLAEMSIPINQEVLVQEQKGNLNDKYLRGKKLGKGTFGIVYEAKNLIFNSKVALKVIPKNARMKYELIKNEIDILKKLMHPNIVRIYEFYESKNSFYLVNEFCPCGELYNYINKTILNEEQLAVIFYQVFSGLTYLHENNILHRDLKPENLLISKIEKDLKDNKEYFWIQIIDFGTAKIFENDKDENLVVGTPYYIAPEVLNKHYNEKCDTWSVGVMLYMFLVGRPPFDGENRNEIINSIKTKDYDENNPKLLEQSPEVRDLIKHLLQKDTNKRFSAKEALNHIWFKKFNGRKLFANFDKKDIEPYIDNLLNYSFKSKIQQLVIAFLVHNLPSTSSCYTILKLYRYFNESGDCKLTKEELIKGIADYRDIENIEEKISNLFILLDGNNNGYIEYEEFLRACIDKNEILNDEYLRYAFKFLDKENNGCLNANEISSAFVLGENENKLFHIAIDKALNDVDGNGDGKIIFEEFKQLMLNL